MLGEQDSKVWTEFEWLRVGSSDIVLWRQ